MTIKGSILQQEADNRKEYNVLRVITRGIPIARLKEICDEERRRMRERDQGKA